MLTSGLAWLVLCQPRRETQQPACISKMGFKDIYIANATIMWGCMQSAIQDAIRRAGRLAEQAAELLGLNGHLECDEIVCPFYKLAELQYATRGNRHSEVITTNQPSRLSFIVESGAIDVVMWGAVVFCFLLLSRQIFNNVRKFITTRQVGTTCSTLTGAAISQYEVRAVTTNHAVLVVVGFAAVASLDDSLDGAAALVLALVALTLSLISVSVGLLVTFLISSSGGGSPARVIIDDLTNIFLGALRVFLCWTRYIFYDLQIEFVDIALQHSDDLLLATTSSATPANLSVLAVFADVVMFAVQVLLSIFKLGIATFLLWLILDLFFLRPSARIHARWLEIRAQP